jgi:deoxyribonuclease V
LTINSSAPWVKTVAEAKVIQEQLRHQVIDADDLGVVRYVAGVDIGFENNFAISQAAIAVLTYPELELVEQAIVRIPTAFPYVPGYLSFREVPAILAAFPQLRITPDLILCDGQGYAHPRRLGLACHLGVLLNIPTIGVAKSRLVGQHEAISQTKGSWQPLLDKGETIGAVLRSRHSDCLHYGLPH